jgi:hypothetical protein
MNKVTLVNDFHNTTVTLMCETLSHIWNEVTIYPSEAQIRRAKKTLCGIDGCTCSSDAGCRGPQKHNGKRLVVDVSSLYASLNR